MKEEKQTGMVVSGSPYRDACAPTERKLSKEEAKTLIEIVRDESYIANDNFYMDLVATEINPIKYLSLAQLERLGYNHQNGTALGGMVYTKDTAFYVFNEKDHPGISLVGNGRITIISGKFYGNLAELIENLRKFEGFCGYVHKKLRFIEAITMYTSLGLSLFFRSREWLKCAMDLPKDFANYKYGEDALEQLRQEHDDMASSKTSQKPSIGEAEASIYEKGLYGKAIATRPYDSIDKDEIKAAELESIISGRSETLGKKKLEKPSLESYYQNLIPKLYGSKTFEDITNLKDKFYMNLPFELKDKNR